MPIYEYCDSGGHVIELRRPVEERNHSVKIDGRVYHRHRFVPSRIGVILPGPTEEQRFNAQVRAGYYDREQKLGSHFNYTGRCGLNKKQLSELWSDTGK